MSKPYNISVIIGLSGVGKTHTINFLKNYSSEYLHFSGGSLIKKRLAIVNRDYLRLSGAQEVLRNQIVLVDQFNEELERIPLGSPVLFDAHTVVDCNEDGLVQIPFDIFEKLNPTRIIFLHDKPETIANRRKQDSSRERPNVNVTEIETQQNLSLTIAKDYSNRLSVPLLELKFSQITQYQEKFLHVE